MEKCRDRKLGDLLVAIIFLLGIIAACEIHREFIGTEVFVELVNEEEK